MIDAGNTAWLITATALVLFMTLPGLALFYGGLVRAENLLSVLMQCLAIACIASVAWLICAYSLAFNGGGAWIGDLGPGGKLTVQFSGHDARQLARLRNAAALSNTFFAVGGAALATGVVLFLLAPARTEHARIVPYATTSELGISVGGSL